MLLVAARASPPRVELDAAPGATLRGDRHVRGRPAADHVGRAAASPTASRLTLGARHPRRRRRRARAPAGHERGRRTCRSGPTATRSRCPPRRCSTSAATDVVWLVRDGKARPGARSASASPGRGPGPDARPGCSRRRPGRRPRRRPGRREGDGACPDDGRPLVAVEDVTRELRAGRGDRRRRCAGSASRIDAGDYVAIIGPSGSGKSTLMHLLGGLDRPTAGRCCIGGRDVAALDGAELAELRNETIGFVFQSFHLLARTSGASTTSRCRWSTAGVRRAERRRPGRRDAGAGRARPPARPPARPAVRRRAAAGRDRPGPGHRARRCCSPTSRPATSTPRSGEEVLALLEALNARARRRAGRRHPRPRGRRPRPTARSSCATG